MVCCVSGDDLLVFSFYGELVLIVDDMMGFEFLKLFFGFFYFMFGWLGDLMMGGILILGNYDGMVVIC